MVASFEPDAFVPQYSQALVMAASRHSRLDTKATPKCLIHIGERPLIHHVLQQLKRVKVKKVVITLGYESQAIRKYLDENNVFEGMEIVYVEVPEHVWAVRDHIFEPKLMERFASTKLTPSEDAFVLVEKDMEGMVGLPASVVEVSIESNNLISGIGDDLEKVDALDAGMFIMKVIVVERSETKPSFFEQLEEVGKEKPYFTIADACHRIALSNRLRAVATDGLTWFAIETKQSLAYAMEQFAQHHRKSWFHLQSTRRKLVSTDPDVKVVGSARKEDRSTTVSGGNWSEFSVEKWRSAVYTAASYFDQLYRDTVSVATEILKESGGAEGASIVEVGCGTGEFLFPLLQHSKHIIGIEINPHFTEWCQQHCPPGHEGKAQFICGDAGQLDSLLKEQAPPSFWSSKRIIACVGNTFGIMPDELKNKIIREMGKAAGPDGYVLIVYWNAACFPDAIENFYGKNQQLCGPFSAKDVDYENVVLHTPSGYRSHWTSVEEAKEVLKTHHLKEVSVKAQGKGVIALAQPMK